MTVGSIWCVSMVKDEADIICDTLRHLISEGVDGILIADNNSADGTYQMVKSFGAAQFGVTRPWQLYLQEDPDPAYYQSEKMTRLAQVAHVVHGADWIVPFDADELWWARDGRLADVLRAAAREVTVAQANLTNYFPTDEDPAGEGAPYAPGRAVDSPFRRIVHRQPEHQALPKVAFRWQPGAVIHQGNHGVTLPVPGQVATLVEISHFPYRSAVQFVRKAIAGAAAYRAAVDLPYDVGAHWRGYGEAYERGGEPALVDIYERWFHRPTPDGFDPPLVRDPAPFCKHRIGA